MTLDSTARGPGTLRYCALAGMIMAYGWGYRGSVGHEAGAMVPGALLGLALALASGRLDWYRRGAVIGLFAAIGWAWGGSLSYMEQTRYVQADTLLDVYYGFSVIFFLGALWAGCGGAILGIGLTEPRSQLMRLIRPFTVICAVFFVIYIVLYFLPRLSEANVTLTTNQFHDGDWLPATVTLIVASIYWYLVPKDRPASMLFGVGALAWWIGYGVLTKGVFTNFHGLYLAPLHRSESWGGVLGILIVLIVYLWRRNNRAALMLCRYGILGGGLAYVAALFVRHPGLVRWGAIRDWVETARWFPFHDWHQFGGWRVAEDCFGLFMGIVIALGALRLLRGRLMPAEEDTPRAPLDVYAVFVMLVALNWINFRRHVDRLPDGADGDALFMGLNAAWWIMVLGALVTAAFMYLLYRYLNGERALVPQSPFGKCAASAMALLGLTVAGGLMDGLPTQTEVYGHLLLWVPATIATLLLVSYAPDAERASIPASATVTRFDPVWRTTPRYWVTCLAVPLIILAVAKASMAMLTPGVEVDARKRFGPDAYWQKTARLFGTWNVIGIGESVDDTNPREENLPITQMTFEKNRSVSARMASGEPVDMHTWFLKNQYTWLRWYGRDRKHPQVAEVPLLFKETRLYIAWPSEEQREGYLVLEKAEVQGAGAG